MGKKRPAKGKPRDSRKRKAPSNNEPYNSEERVIVRENQAFEAYYKKQGIVKAEEWDDFKHALQDPLPAAFRVTGSKSQAKQMLNIIKDEYFTAINSSSQGDTTAQSAAAGDSDASLTSTNKPDTTSDEQSSDSTAAAGEKLTPPRCLSWYPENLAWQLDYSRVSIRKHVHLNKLRGFLLSESESGNISRQETVSMIPPLLMDIKQEHNVLDMCAAPGSKTAQLIEYLHAASTKSIPDGMVIANDVDNKRCYMMVHQIKRLQSPNMLIINHDATRLPNMYQTNRDTGERERLLFDRILADVPCSGDGTMRKNPDIWRNWSLNHATNLHNVQKRVLERGLELLKVGGRLVYSTCSFNPIENEAVIGHMLSKCEGSVKVVDCSGELDGLVRVPGVDTWQVMMPKTEEWFQSFTEVPEASRSLIRPTMFPVENIKEFGIKHCMRIIPHHQNTGGFFIAVLEKTGPLPWMNSETDKTSNTQAAITSTSDKPSMAAPSPDRKNTTAVTESKAVPVERAGAPLEGTTVPVESAGAPLEGTTVGEPMETEVENSASDVPMNGSGNSDQKKGRDRGKKDGYQGFKEDPFYYLEKNAAAWPQIKEFYGISDEFDHTWLMVRSKETVKNKTIYLTSSSIKNFITHNENNVKFITCGVRVLERNEHDKAACLYRPVHEGLESMNPYICKRRVTMSRGDILALLVNENPLFEKFSVQAQSDVADIGVGGVVFSYKHTDRSGLTSDICMSGWRGVMSCRLYVPRYERHHFLRLCGADPDQVLIKGEYAVKGTTNKPVRESSNDEQPESAEQVVELDKATSADSLEAEKVTSSS